VGEPAKRSRSPAPTIEELVSQLTQRSTTVVKPQAPIIESRTEPAATTGTEESAVTQAEEEAPTVVWTSLGPLPQWVPGPTTRWAPGITRLVLHGT
jgi:hypothetical protein